jgi:hypothetical protein
VTALNPVKPVLTFTLSRYLCYAMLAQYSKEKKRKEKKRKEKKRKEKKIHLPKSFLDHEMSEIAALTLML